MDRFLREQIQHLVYRLNYYEDLIEESERKKKKVEPEIIQMREIYRYELAKALKEL